MSDQNMSEQSAAERVKKLVSDLSFNRNSRAENALCQEIRVLSGDKKLEVVQALASFNVRLGASVASRVHLPVSCQVLLIRSLLAVGESNAIKYFVMGLFVHRMRTTVVIRELEAAKSKSPNPVRLMAYYYSSLKGIRNCVHKSALVKLRHGI
ncbi:hypothetical protein HU751_025530 [Pseudomonas sp. BW13M1]|uniref:Uncharacterized protein n=1 Tax=Pseudomonas peradeniyensis TaxID=2745488 RepID=A0A923G813_9PSED|nr:hypothetical protein [Pseudomonas peradeniyensis]MBV4508200.1 hypothetical protein [Pseudomonas peradeniyensis]